MRNLFNDLVLSLLGFFSDSFVGCKVTCALGLPATGSRLNLFYFHCRKETSVDTGIIQMLKAQRCYKNKKQITQHGLCKFKNLNKGLKRKLNLEQVFFPLQIATHPHPTPSRGEKNLMMDCHKPCSFLKLILRANQHDYNARNEHIDTTSTVTVFTPSETDVFIEVFFIKTSFIKLFKTFVLKFRISLTRYYIP